MATANPSASLGVRTLRQVVRVFRTLAVGLVGLVTLAGVLLTLLLGTAPGRSALWSWVQDPINELLPGRLELKRIEQLSPLGIELLGARLLDPDGTEVARMGRARVALNLRALVRGDLVLDDVTVEHGLIDARVLEPRRGLLAAVVDPDAPTTPPSPTPPPDVTIRRILLHDVLVRAPPLPRLGQVDAQLARLEGDFALLAGEPVMELKASELLVTRDGEQVLSLELSAALERTGLPSRLELHAKSLGMRLDVEGTGHLPSQAGWETRPAHAVIALHGVDAERLSHLLRDPKLAGAFQGALELQLKGEGTPERPSVSGALLTSAGRIDLTELSLGPEASRCRLSLHDFQPDALRADLPPTKLDLELAVEKSGPPQELGEFSLVLSQARLSAESLPELRLTGRLSPQGVDPFALEVRDGESRLAADGSLNFDGSGTVAVRLDLRPTLVTRLGQLLGANATGRLTGTLQTVRSAEGHLSAEGRLAVQQARWQTVTLDSAQAELKFTGVLPALAGQVHLSVASLTAGGATLDRLDMRAEGGPERYAVDLSAEAAHLMEQTSPDLHEGPSQVLLHADVLRHSGATDVSAEIQGNGGGQAFEVHISPTVVTDVGRVETSGVVLMLGEERLELTGGFGGPSRSRDEGLHFVSGALDLQRIRRMVGLSAPTTGTVRLTGDLSGSPTVPILELTVAGERLGLEKKPTFDLNLNALFNAQTGKASVDTQVDGGPGLSAHLDATLSFPGGAGYLARLLAAEAQVTLGLERLESDFVAGYLPPGTIPLTGSLRGKVAFNGTFQAPALRSNSHLRVRDGEFDVDVDHVLHFQGAALRSELTITDRLGPWAQLLAAIDLPSAPDLLSLGETARSAVREAAWQVDLRTTKRELTQLPLAHELLGPGTEPPFAVTLELSSSHALGEDPNLDVQLIAEQSREMLAGGCAAAGLRTTLELHHQDAANSLSLLAHVTGKEVLRLDLNGEQELLPLLEGASARPGQVSLTLKSKELEIAEVPFVCGRAQGRLAVAADASDLFGTTPHARLSISAQDFSLGDIERLSGKLTATATEQGGKLHGTLQGTGAHRNSRAKVDATLPWQLSQGRFTLEEDLPLDVDLALQHLPIAPFLAPKGSLSYASGTLDGALKVGGRLRSPTVVGDLRLENMAFTSTAVAQPLRGVQGHLRFDQRKLTIKHFEAHDRSGTLTLGGTIDLSDLKKVEAKVDILADDFPLRQQGQVVAVTNIKATAHSIVEPEQTVAELRLHAVDTWLENATIRSGIALDQHPEFIVNGQGGTGINTASASRETEPEPNASPTAQAKAPREGASAGSQATPSAPQTPHVVRLRIDARERFWIKRDDFAVKLSADLDTQLRGDEVRVKGDVLIDRGYLQLFGKVFDLKRGSRIEFIGASPPNPVLSLEGEHQTRSGSLIAVRITGRGDAPQLTFLVDGAEVDASIAVDKLFGTGEQKGTEKDATTQAQGVISGITAGVLATAARRELGAAAPIVMIDPSDKAGEGRVRAGFELDEAIPQFLRPVITGAYVEGIVARESAGDTKASTSFGTLLEVYFLRNFYGAGQYGPGTTWSIDFGWQL